MHFSRTTALIAGFGFLVGAAMVYIFLMKPSYTTLTAFRVQTAQVALDITEKQSVAEKIRELITTYQSVAVIRDLLARSLPSNGIDAAAVTGEINAIAEENLVSLLTLSYEAVPIAALPDPTKNAKYGYGGMKVKIEVVGSYEHIKDFAIGLESNMRIFDIKDMKIESVDEKLARANILRGEVTIQTYYQSDQEPPATRSARSSAPAQSGAVTFK